MQLIDPTVEIEPPSSEPVCASTTDLQAVCDRPKRDNCRSGNSGYDESCEMGPVGPYEECTAVIEIIKTHVYMAGGDDPMKFGYLGLKDGKVSSTGGPANYRNYRLMVKGTGGNPVMLTKPDKPAV